MFRRNRYRKNTQYQKGKSTAANKKIPREEIYQKLIMKSQNKQISWETEGNKDVSVISSSSVLPVLKFINLLGLFRRSKNKRWK